MIVNVTGYAPENAQNVNMNFEFKFTYRICGEKKNKMNSLFPNKTNAKLTQFS